MSQRSLPAALVRALMCAFALVHFLVGAGRCEPPRALEKGQLPRDQRLGPLKDLNGDFPFTPSNSKAEWAARADRVRRRILVANGLWPLPAKTPARAVVHGKVLREGYSVE